MSGSGCWDVAMKCPLGFFLVAMIFVAGPALAEPAAIGEIRKQYSAIVNGKPNSVEQLEFSCEGEPTGGTMTVRRYPGELMAVKLSYVTGDHGGSEQNFYFKDGALFFVLQTDQYWTFTGQQLANGESETIDRATQHRYYFDGGRCIRQLTKQVEASIPDEIPNLLGQAPNTEVDPGGEVRDLQQRASALRKVQSAADLQRIFCGG